MCAATVFFLQQDFCRAILEIDISHVFEICDPNVAQRLLKDGNGKIDEIRED